MCNPNRFHYNWISVPIHLLPQFVNSATGILQGTMFQLVWSILSFLGLKA